MPSGKRFSAMIFCLSPFEKLYSEPIEYYEPDIIHVFIGNREDLASEEGRKKYEKAKKNIVCGKIVEHEVDVSDYDKSLSKLIEIKKELYSEFGNDVDVFVNISSGTPEFSAAGLFASMLPGSAIAFKVKTESSMDKEKFSSFADEMNGSLKLSEPEIVTGLKNDEPDREMIVFLEIVDRILSKNKYPKFKTIIEEMKSLGVWSYDPSKKSGYGKTPLEEKEERYLKRHYIALALENGWIVRPSPNRMVITKSGKAYISVYSHKMEKCLMCESESVREFECLRMRENVSPNERRFSFIVDMEEHR